MPTIIIPEPLPNKLLDLLIAIRKRPAMYISYNSICNLKSYIDGWLYAKNYEVEDIEILDSFHDWIIGKFEIKTAQSWDRIILFYSTDESTALNYFFELFDSFLSDSKKV